MKKEKNPKIIKGAGDRTIRYSQVREFISAEDENRIQEWARQAVIEGQSRQGLTKLVYDLFREVVGNYDFIEISGQLYRLRKYAELVAGAALGEAQTEAQLDLCRQYENDLVEISDHQTDCEICKEFESKVYSISGKHKTYPKLEKAPPFHLGCGHSMLPTSEEAILVEEARKR